MNRQMLMVAMVMVCLGTAHFAIATPTAEELKPFEKQMNKKVALQLDTTLERAMKFLAKTADLKIRLDRANLQGMANLPNGGAMVLSCTTQELAELARENDPDFDSHDCQLVLFIQAKVVENDK